MASLLARASVALLLLVAAGGAHPVKAQNYDGDGIVRVGLFAQGQWLDIDQSLPGGSGELSGFAGGISAGYDFWHSSRFVLGFEGDVSFGDIQDTVCCTSYGFDYLATLRGRAGVHMHPGWLVYATGGVAWLGVEAQSIATNSKVAETLTGWTVGGGTEVDWHHMILFAEYLYADFGSASYTLDGVPERADFDGHLVRVGIKLKVGHDYFGSYLRDDYLRPLK